MAGVAGRTGAVTLQTFWRGAVARVPEKTAAVCGSRRLTYAEADALCRALAARLSRYGRGRELRVAVLLPNGIEYFLLYWALVRCAGVIVPINPWLKSESLDAILETVSPALVVLPPTSAPELEKSLALHPQIASIRADALLEGLADSPTEEDADIEAAPDDIAIIMHTSGTTAAPKGAVMRHRDLEFNVATTIFAQGFLPDDIHLIVNPMFHCTALYSSLPSAACQGSTVVITAETQPDALMRLIGAERITTFLTVPSILQRIVALPDIGSYDKSTLRVIGYAGSFMPVKTVRALQRLFPSCELHNFFGLTETISATHVLETADALERPDSIGRLLPGVEACVVREDGTRCNPGEVGELLFARENVIPCYYGKPGKLEESFLERDGRTWFRTGDLASLDADGFFFIKGRRKEMIIVGGENVFASEVESVVLSMDEVRDAYVKGIPATGIRASLGELIVAVVTPEQGVSLTEADVRRYCAGRLPSYKVPHRVEFVTQIPRNPSGKVIRS